jgi:hypothetical protein
VNRTEPQQDTDVEREAERQAFKNRLAHCLTCGSHTEDVPHHLHRHKDKPLHSLAQAKERQAWAKSDLAHWTARIAEMEANSEFMTQVEAAVADLTPFGKKIAAHWGLEAGGISGTDRGQA